MIRVKMSQQNGLFWLKKTGAPAFFVGILVDQVFLLTKNRFG